MNKHENINNEIDKDNIIEIRTVQSSAIKILIEALKEIREIAREEKNPALVKICRLCYTYIEENENFDINFGDEEEELGMTDLEYLLELMLQSEREVNLQEIREIRDLLTTELYG